MKAFFRSFKQRLVDQFWQGWQEKIQTSNRYDIYRTLKYNHHREHYVESITITKFRKAYARFRLGITKIRNNERFLKPYSSTFCLSCQPNVKEDEYHFLLVCPMYNELRIKYLKRCWITLNSLTIQDLIANENEWVTRCTAMYIYHADRLRELLYT